MAAADAAVDINAVNQIVRQAVEGIDVGNDEQQEGQALVIRVVRPHLTDRDAQYIVNFLQRHPRAVNSLQFGGCDMTRQAVEIFHTHFSTNNSTMMSLRSLRFVVMNLDNETGRRLFAGLHGNRSVEKLELSYIVLEGDVFGDIITELLQNNSSLTNLICLCVNLGVSGARALQPGIRANQTLEELMLAECNLGDEGVALVVDAIIEENNNNTSTINDINLQSNHITFNGLAHLTRLIMHPSIKCIKLDKNPGLFHHEESTRLFANTLRNATVESLSLDFCKLPGHAITSLFDAVVNHPTLINLSVFDTEQLQQGVHRANLLEIIPKMQHLLRLSINLDFTDEIVLAAFHRNSSIQHLLLYTTGDGDQPEEEITDGGPVFASLDRNRRLAKANQLLDTEPGQMIPLGLWSKAIEQLTRDNNNTGATAVYKIMQNKLVMWWAPN